jgi:hypothetical protein
MGETRFKGLYIQSACSLVMWTHTQGDELPENRWRPNHLVALLPTFVAASQESDSTSRTSQVAEGMLFEDDDWSLHLDNSYVNNLLQAIVQREESVVENELEKCTLVTVVCCADPVALSSDGPVVSSADQSAAVQHVPTNFPKRIDLISDIVESFVGCRTDVNIISNFVQHCPTTGLSGDQLAVADRIWHVLWKVSNVKMTYHNLFIPNVSSCLIPECNGSLSATDSPSTMTVFTMKGPLPGLKALLKCCVCHARYNIDTYHTANGPAVYYPRELRADVYQASNTVYFETCLKLCASRLHSVIN